MGTDDTLSMALFSGTDDRLSAAAILAAGAAAMGRKVNVLLQYWALQAFQADRILKDHGVSADAGIEGAELLRFESGQPGHMHWSEIFRQAKDIGEVGIHGCAKSMELFGLAQADLDPLVDDVEGVAAFMLEATGPVVFI